MGLANTFVFAQLVPHICQHWCKLDNLIVFSCGWDKLIPLSFPGQFHISIDSLVLSQPCSSQWTAGFTYLMIPWRSRHFNHCFLCGRANIFSFIWLVPCFCLCHGGLNTFWLSIEFLSKGVAVKTQNYIAPVLWKIMWQGRGRGCWTLFCVCT